jgi:hypothetical protein
VDAGHEDEIERKAEKRKKEKKGNGKPGAFHRPR